MKLTDVLRKGRQCDEDGVEIIMSRQACCEAANRIEELEAEIQRLTDLIKKHNGRCQSKCESNKDIGRCDCYIIRDKHCSDCPREYEIEISCNKMAE